MLYFFSGTDRGKARAAMDTAVKKLSKKDSRIVRISDANQLNDLRAALGGRGMFDSSRVVVLNGVLENEEMGVELLAALAHMRDSEDPFFILEEKPDATTRKQIEKYAEKSEKFEAPKAERDDTFFKIANALQNGKKKELWLLLSGEFAAGKAAEMLHGNLFWAAKQMVLRPRTPQTVVRGKKLIAELAELPHESRRRGVELEYALELFVLR